MATTSSGYSGTPLPKKLGIREGSRVAVVSAPDGFDRVARAAPRRRAAAHRARGRVDVVVFFVTRRAELARRFPAFVRALEPDGGLWVAWPKKTSGVATDLVVRRGAGGRARRRARRQQGVRDRRHVVGPALRPDGSAETARTGRSMCGRFVSVSSPQLLVERFGVEETAVEDARARLQRHARGRWCPSCGSARPARASKGPPSGRSRWCAGASCPRGPRAPRSATSSSTPGPRPITEKAAYQRAFAQAPLHRPRRRVLRVAAVEEHARPSALRASRTSCTAATASRWRSRGCGRSGATRAVADDDDPDAWVRSCVIVTTQANELLEPIHSRMPVMLDEADWDTWLDPATGDVGALEAMLGPRPTTGSRCTR